MWLARSATIVYPMQYQAWAGEKSDAPYFVRGSRGPLSVCRQQAPIDSAGRTCESAHNGLIASEAEIHGRFNYRLSAEERIVRFGHWSHSAIGVCERIGWSILERHEQFHLD
jgi:hypothetical protein